MKVTKNSLAFPFVYKGQDGSSVACLGTPLRLEIASRLLAAMIMNDSFDIKLLSRESVYKKLCLLQTN